VALIREKTPSKKKGAPEYRILDKEKCGAGQKRSSERKREEEKACDGKVLKGRDRPKKRRQIPDLRNSSCPAGQDRVVKGEGKDSSQGKKGGWVAGKGKKKSQTLLKWEAKPETFQHRKNAIPPAGSSSKGKREKKRRRGKKKKEIERKRHWRHLSNPCSTRDFLAILKRIRFALRRKAEQNASS